MSLDWSLTKIENWQKLCWLPDPENAEETRLNPVTHTLIFRAMTVGMGQITEKNYVEFYLRCKLASECFGQPLQKNGDTFDVTLEDVKAHIGLSTNVSNTTITSFMKNVKEEIEMQEKRKQIRRDAQAAITVNKLEELA